METYQKNLLDFVSKLSIIRYQYAEIMNASAQDLGNNGDRIKEFASILTNIITCKHRLTRAHREKQLKTSCQALHNAPPNRT